MSTSKNLIENNLLWNNLNALYLAFVSIYAITGYVSLYRLATILMSVALALEIYLPIASARLSVSSMVEKFFLNEGSPYAILSLLMYLLPPVPLLLLPLATLSLFKLLSFSRTFAPIRSHPLWRDYGQQASDQLLAYRPTMQTLIAHFELATMFYLILMLFRVGISWPLVWLSFLRWQYFVSNRTRLVCVLWDDAVMSLTGQPSCPPNLRKAYMIFREYLGRWVRITPHGVAPNPVSSASAGAGANSSANNGHGSSRSMPPVGRR